MEYAVPESWTEKVSDENLKYYYPEGGMLMVDYSETTDTISSDESRDEFLNGFTSELESPEIISETEIMIDTKTAYRYELDHLVSGEEYQTSLVVFNYENGIVAFYMATEKNSNQDYGNQFETILNSIVFAEEAVVEENEATVEPEQVESYFDGKDLVTEDYKITITDYKVIQPGESGNEYGDSPVIAFWYDTTVSEDVLDTEYNPTTVWIMNFEAVQDNDPNLINKLSVGTHPDRTYVETQLATIKPGGTVTNAVAYELTDTETPVTLTAIGNLFTNEELGSYTYQIQ